MKERTWSMKVVFRVYLITLRLPKWKVMGAWQEGQCQLLRLEGGETGPLWRRQKVKSSHILRKFTVLWTISCDPLFHECWWQQVFSVTSLPSCFLSISIVLIATNWNCFVCISLLTLSQEDRYCWTWKGTGLYLELEYYLAHQLTEESSGVTVSG